MKPSTLVLMSALLDIELHFNQLADQSDRPFFNPVPTSFQLPSRTVDRLRQLAAHQLADNQEFRRLVSDLKGCPVKWDEDDED